jgi:hypothetical protein
MSCNIPKNIELKCETRHQSFLNKINIIYGKVYFDSTYVGDVFSFDSEKIIYKEPNGELRTIKLMT